MPRITRTGLARLALTGALLVPLAVAAGLTAEAPRVQEEGDRARRATLAPLSGAEADQAWFKDLEAGSNASGSLVPEKDHVTVIATIDVAEPASIRIAGTIARLADRFGERGMRALLVHPDEGWGDFAERIERGLIKAPAARDVGGTLTAALKTDDVPDVYIFDRSGSLRYADIESRSVAAAVVELLGETPEEAAKAAQQLRDAAPEASDKPKHEPNPDTPGTDGRDGDHESAPAIPDSAYDAAPWPEHGARNTLGGSPDFQGKKLPEGFDTLTWVSPKPEDDELQRKVLVLDIWATYFQPYPSEVLPIYAKHAKAMQDAITVVGITGMPDRKSSQTPEEVRKTLAKVGMPYPQANDPDGAFFERLGIHTIPHVYILSTDGVVRWQGNPRTRAFEPALRAVIEADPMLAAARAKPDPDADDTTKPDTPTHNAADDTGSWPPRNTGQLFATTDIQGQTLSDAFRGVRWLDRAPRNQGRVTFIVFWATWNQQSVDVLREVADIADKQRDDLAVVSIAGVPRTGTAETLEQVGSFLRRTPISDVSHGYDAQRTLYDLLGVRRPPYVIVLDAKNVVRWQGFPAAVDLEDLAEDMIDANEEAYGRAP